MRDCEQTCRELSAVLDMIHKPGNVANLSAVVTESKALFAEKVRPQLAELFKAVPDGQYYRFYNVFNWTLQRLVFAAAMTHFVDKEKLLFREEVAGGDWLGISGPDGDGGQRPHLDLEDYLGGLLQLSNEMARFSKTCVIQDDYEWPLRVAAFVRDLQTGFQLLNLKNDALRKKFDGLKYSRIQVEDVVWNLKIRGKLVEKKKEDAEGGDAKKDGAATATTNEEKEK